MKNFSVTLLLVLLSMTANKALAIGHSRTVRALPLLIFRIREQKSRHRFFGSLRGL